MRIVQFLFEEMQERKEGVRKERLMLLALAFSSAFSGDFTAIEEILGEDTRQIEDSDGSLEDFSIKKE